MTAIELPNVADRQLYRIIDSYASTEAAAALNDAAARARGGRGVLADALASAAAVMAAEDAAALDRLSETVASGDFFALVPGMIRELREIASDRPDSGACTIASAFDLWLWTAMHFRGEHADELGEALCPLLAARAFALEVAANGDRELRADLAHVYGAHAAATAGTACAELVYGYRHHLTWDAAGCASCFAGEQIDELEAIMPGIASGARMSADVVEADGSHVAKAGPCASFDGLDSFVRLRTKLDGCLTGARIAKDRAAAAIAGRS